MVTGANRGIGYEIARQLARQGLCVVLTARDADRGSAAAEALRGEGLNVEFRQLDVCHAESVELFAKWVGDKYRGVDILVRCFPHCVPIVVLFLIEVIVVIMNSIS